MEFNLNQTQLSIIESVNNIMKNYDEEIALKTDFVSKKNIKSEKIKTTNINILLNRVRLDRKKTLLKKILFTFLLASTVSLIGTYFIL